MGIKVLYQILKKISAGVVIAIFVIFCLSACGNSEIGEKSLLFADADIVIPYGVPINITDYLIWGTYDSITIDPVKFSTVGVQDLRVIVFYQGKRTEKTLKVTVIDKTPPVFIKQTADIDIHKGDILDIAKHFEANDEIDGRVDIRMSKLVDTSKTGKVEIEVIAVDGSNNESRMTCKVVISEVPKPDEVADGGNEKTKKKKKKGNNGGSPGGGSDSNKEPKITGVKDRTIDQGSSKTKLIQVVMSGVVCVNSSGCRVTPDVSGVDLNTKGSYTVYFNTNIGISASCKVKVK